MKETLDGKEVTIVSDESMMMMTQAEESGDASTSNAISGKTSFISLVQRTFAPED